MYFLNSYKLSNIRHRYILGSPRYFRVVEKEMTRLISVFSRSVLLVSLSRICKLHMRFLIVQAHRNIWVGWEQYFRNLVSLNFDFGRNKIVLNFVINGTYFGTLLSAQNLWLFHRTRIVNTLVSYFCTYM